MTKSTARWMGATISALAVALVAAGAADAQQDFSKVEIRTTALRGGVYMLAGAGGNMGLSTGEDGLFLIDDEYAPLTEKIGKAIAAIQKGPVRFLLNTHWHGDHTGGNENLGKAGVLIVAQDNVRQRMSTDQFTKAFGRKVEASPKAALPVVTFNDTITFHLNGDTIHAFHVPPAHTDGDSVIVFEKADVIHTGDVFFNGFYPFIDVSSGGSIDGMIAAAQRIHDMAGPDTQIIPGHGPLGDREQLAAYVGMLRQVRDAVAKLVDAGKSRDEAIAAKPTTDLDPTWGKGFLEPDAFVGIVYDSLTALRDGR